VNEHVDLATVKFHRKTAKASAPSCPATPHSACGGFPPGFGFDGRTVRRLLNHPNVLSDGYCSAIVPDCIGGRTRYDNEPTSTTTIGRSTAFTPNCALRRPHRADFGRAPVLAMTARLRRKQPSAALDKPEDLKLAGDVVG
jgi:hypothetical protein